MGWTGMQKPVNVKAYLDKEFTWSSSQNKCEVLRSAIVNIREYYAAVECHDINGKRTVVCAVVLLDYRRGERETFFYKVMDETAGPNQVRCPEAILKLLTSPEGEWSTDWREKCRSYHAQRKMVSAWPYGQLIKFPHSPEHYRKIDYQYSKQKNIFRNEITGRLSRFRQDQLMTAQAI